MKRIILFLLFAFSLSFGSVSVVDNNLPLDTLVFPNQAIADSFKNYPAYNRKVVRDWIDTTSTFKLYASDSGSFEYVGGDSGWKFDGKLFVDSAAMRLYAARAVKFAGIDTTRTWVTFKVGDLRRRRDGFPVDNFDPINNFLKTGNIVNPDYQFTPWHRTVYVVAIAKRSWNGAVNGAIQDTGDTKDSLGNWARNDNYRWRRKRIDFKKVANWLGDTTLVQLWRSKQPKPIIDLTELNKDSLLSATYGVTLDSVPDSNAISSGTYTVGSGGDYATWTAAEADIGGTLTGNLVFNQIAAVTEAGEITFDSDIDSDTITFNSNEKTFGNPSSGYAISYGGAASCFTMDMDGPGKMIIKNLYFKRTSNGSSSRYSVQAGAGVNEHDLDMYGCLSNLQTYSGSHFKFGHGTGSACMVWNLVTMNGNGSGIFLDGWPTGAANRIENVTVWNCSTSFDLGTENAIMQNCLSLACKKRCFSNQDSATGYNNASSDTSASNVLWKTASGNIKSVTINNEVMSTASIAQCLKLHRYGSAWNLGATPGITANTSGIRNNTRPGPYGTSIGADEYDNVPAVINFDSATGLSNQPDTASLAYLFTMNTADTVGDSLKNIVTGTKYDMLGANTVSTAKYGNGGMDFNGANDQIYLGDVPAIEAESSFTVTFWYRPDNIANNEIFLWSQDGATNELYINHDGTNFYLFCANGGNATRATSLIPTGYCNSQWHFFAYRFDGTLDNDADTMSIWFNGRKLPSGSKVGPMPLLSPALTDPIKIGTYNAGGLSPDGTLDNYKIYSRALTNAEILTEYMATREQYDPIDTTTNGKAYADTATFKSTMDSIQFRVNGSSDTVTLALSDSLAIDLDAILIDNQQCTVFVRGKSEGDDGEWLELTVNANLECVTVFDTTYDTLSPVPTTCLSSDSSRIDSTHILIVDSICNSDTFPNWFKDTLVYARDTLLPTIDTTFNDCDSIQLTISACNGDTTARDTFWSAADTKDTTRIAGSYVSAPIIYGSDTGASVNDSVRDTVTFVVGDTTFRSARDSITACSTKTDSAHKLNRNDSVQYTITCEGDTVATDTFGRDTTYTDSTTTETSLCAFVAWDTLAPYDTTISTGGPSTGIHNKQYHRLLPIKKKAHAKNAIKNREDEY